MSNLCAELACSGRLPCAGIFGKLKHSLISSFCLRLACGAILTSPPIFQIGRQLDASLSERWRQMPICSHMPGCQRMPEYARYACTCQSAATCQLWAQIGQQPHGSLSDIWLQMSICRHMPALGKKLYVSESLRMKDMPAHANLPLHASSRHKLDNS